MTSDALAGLDDIPWSRLRTCRGDASRAPAALRNLSGDDEDAREDAWAFLQDDLWHQGTLYEACAHALPFILRLAANPSSKDRADLVEYAVVVVGSARRNPSEQCSREVQDALARCVPELTVMLDDPVTGGSAALVLGGMVSDVTRVLVDAIQKRPTAQLFMAMVMRESVEGAVRARAIESLVSTEEALPVAAAYLLAMRGGAPGDDVKGRIEELATPVRVTKLVAECRADWMEWPLPALAKPRGPLEEASVVFASSNLVVANHATRGRFTLRIPDSGLASGDDIRLGGFTNVRTQVARIVEFSTRLGTRRVEFDELGNPLR